MAFPDPIQRAAVEHLAGAALVAGPAGSGKTRVLIERACRAVEQGIAAPERVLCLAYTAAAAQAMRQALQRRGPASASGIQVESLPDLCGRILSTAPAPDGPVAGSNPRGEIERDELAIRACAWLTENPEVRRQWEERFDLVQADDLQDLHPAEYEIVRVLGARGGKMALAGDPAQAIHRRESAPPGQVQAQFARDFDPAPFALGGTHRATRALWMAADSYARASRGLDGRYSGQASGPESLLGAPIEIAVRSDEAGEARWIGERLRVLRNTAGWPSDSVFGRAAILTRTHSRAIAIREALVARHGPAIPCEVLGWKAPFQLQDRVTLCAIHQAKGLEFDYVFIAGAVDGELPDAPADDRARRDEEDRLFYVAMTRARKRLFISYHAADERGRARRPSPCLGRIDPAYCADV